jgi:hypothetical protein
MNYEALYSRFIEHRRAKGTPAGYFERHHVIPRCEGGSDDPSNIVDLTARDHIFAHLILAKWKGGKHWYALAWMLGNIYRSVPTAQEIRIAAKAKEEARLARTGLKWTEVHRANIGAALSSPKTRAKMSASAKRRRASPETKAKLSRAHKGRVLSQETRAKMSASATGKKKSEAHRANLSRALIGSTPSNKGVPISSERRAHLSATNLANREKYVEAARRGWAKRKGLDA